MEHTHVLLYFGAEWCGPCKRLKPVVEEIRREFPKLLVSEVDIDSQHEFASEYSIKSVPTCILIDSNGDEVARTIGARSKADLVKDLMIPTGD